MIMSLINTVWNIDELCTTKPNQYFEGDHTKANKIELEHYKSVMYGNNNL